MRDKFLRLLGSLLVLSCLRGGAQNYAVEASIQGGREQLEQVLQTQLTLPKTLLSASLDKELIVYFDLDDNGNATNVRVEGQTNNVLRQEIKRLVGLMKYNKTTNNYKDPYYLTLKITGQDYSRYYKQRSKPHVKKEIPADSSQVIYSKADRSPEYYKNGESGMEEYILGAMEYPRLAIEKSVEGTVVIDFVVETNGFVTNLSVRQPVGAGCSEEALRVLKLSKWQPAVLNGKYVRYKTSYPITFSLRNISNDNSSSSRAVGQ